METQSTPPPGKPRRSHLRLVTGFEYPAFRTVLLTPTLWTYNSAVSPVGRLPIICREGGFSHLQIMQAANRDVLGEAHFLSLPQVYYNKAVTVVLALAPAQGDPSYQLALVFDQSPCRNLIAVIEMLSLAAVAGKREKNICLFTQGELQPRVYGNIDQGQYFSLTQEATTGQQFFWLFVPAGVSNLDFLFAIHPQLKFLVRLKHGERTEFENVHFRFQVSLDGNLGPTLALVDDRGDVILDGIAVRGQFPFDPPPRKR